VKRPFHRIRTTIALALAALVFATAVAMALLSNAFTQDAVERNSRDYTAQLVAQAQSAIDSYVANMESIARVVLLNEQVQAWLAGGLTAAQQRSARAAIAAFLNSVASTRPDVSLILVAGYDGRVLTHDPRIRLSDSVHIPDQEWFKSARAAGGLASVSSSHVQNIVEGEYRWVITLSRTINDPATGADRGVLAVDLNFSAIKDLASRISLGRKGYVFIVDSAGRIVYHPRQELLYSGLEREHVDQVLARPGGSFEVRDDKGLRIYTVSASRSTGWRTVGVNYADEMVRNRLTIRRYYALSALACVAAAVLVSVLLSHRLSRPITRLRASMQAVERGDFDIAVDVSSRNEIGELAKDFNIMIAQIRELVRRNSQEQEQKRRSELIALQNQITPHFLYNTLDSVIWMAEGGQHANVVTTVSALARLLRLSVSRGDELISIRDEIEHIRNYLTIQKVRYRDKLDYIIDVDDALLTLRTPKVILQPLVENAIYHGIKNKEQGGRVAVTGRLRDGEVVLSVEDDGEGMSDEQLRALLEGPAEEPAGAAAGAARRQARRTRVGVRNVHERIQLYFGPRYGLRFTRNGGGGTIVDVRLPFVASGGAGGQANE
jgi:two-component system, sensor histidine kinase YesM